MSIDSTERPPAAQPRPHSARAGLRRWWRRRPVNRALVLLHRWPALVLGLFLVIECTSGAVLLYHREIFRVTNGELYHHSASGTPVDQHQALQLVQRETTFPASWVGNQDGVYVVGDNTYTELYFVDPGSGHINGHTNLDQGVMGWLVNLHDCAFACEGLPWYSAWLAHPVWTNGPSFLTDITWANVVLGVLGCLTILLVLTSLKIWWPGRQRLGSRFTVRRGRGRFARDYDLHNVIGAIGLPFVLMWGITGAAFAFPGIEKGWIAATGGDTDTPDFSIRPTKVAPGTPAVTYDQATSIALRKVPGQVTIVYTPTEDVPYYEIDVRTGYAGSAGRLVYNGDAYVLIDGHDANNLQVIEAGHGEPAGNRFYEKFLEPTHFGWNVNGWWRILWAVLGLTPLALMVTGVSTWLYRRGVKKRRRKAGRAKLADAQLDPDVLGREGELDVAELDPGDTHGGTVPDEGLVADRHGVLHPAEASGEAQPRT
ncbi:Uncharacterized iron-regulated membrane protein [Jatrophihabitans endophyticus]|uniref:Uncharacterized iron-regulated membrane protein n=1 Tax=Jatrophihabitans endophyticus TaxID=1206085 RepID=A0A1M5UP94_9ACTN|nr:PepSY-associated TM helix domain-containing protein [Jatrophihabitans endophyticus]SHH64892.1 Uncharacterized iron-regulated membrane protein [Jatrophihabitans endophyticus]